MSVSTFLIFFFLFHQAFSRCPQSFNCGDLGTIEFPLTIHTQPNCGLFRVNCTTSERPRIQFAAHDVWYEIVQFVTKNKLMIFDHVLESQLQSRDCSSFANLPLSPPSCSLTISSNITFFKCPKDSNGNNKYMNEYFQRYESVNCSLISTGFYRDRRDVYSLDDSIFSSFCSEIKLPKNPNRESGDLFELLTPEFTIEWNVSDDCSRCYNEGGQCSTNDYGDEFLCRKGTSKTILHLVEAGFAVVLIFIFISVKFIIIVKNRSNRETGNQKEIESFLKSHENLAPKRYNYKKLKKITNSFNYKLGKGGYGSVYQGKLEDGRLVAVKILDESKGNGEEFMNEVASISRTSHVNIVSLLGFCFDGCRRALIYEFMPNGSLEKFIYNSEFSSGEVRIGWEKLFEIAVGIARGLEYLHQGCNTRILHLDIKPQNILLDKDLKPKIADFGLAKLCPNRASIVSMVGARGTIGYIAPEVFCRNFGDVSYKSDVYSYGMMVLDMVGKRNDDPSVDGTSEVYFPQNIYMDLEIDVENGGLEENVNEDESQHAKRKLTIIGLWCIQTDPKDRPSMSGVLEMLEGKIESLEVPPKPQSSSAARLASSYSNSRSTYSNA